MKTFDITMPGQDIRLTLQHKIDFKTKPLGSLGELEKIAMQIGTIQQSCSPKLEKPAIIVFAGDHGIANDGVSAYPQEVTYQMVMNFLNDGAAINAFCKQHHIELLVVDAGVNFDFPPSKKLIDAKISRGTRSFLQGAAMTRQQCETAIDRGAQICHTLFKNGTNILGFGEMGIGNTSAASMIMSKVCQIPLRDCIGRGSGLNDEQLLHKQSKLEKAAETNHANTPLDVMATFGGFEMAMMCGAMLQAAENKMVVMVDGFIATAVFLVAHALAPQILDYAIFCHQSDEQGHRKMLEYLKAKPLLSLGMRLGEGTGCALAYPIVQSSLAFLNDMASFESAGVTSK